MQLTRSGLNSGNYVDMGEEILQLEEDRLNTAPRCGVLPEQLQSRRL
jgi:hypothetical protein